jgi:hypothetical protein
MSIWGKPHEEHAMEREMLLARLKALEGALEQILELADGHHDEHEALLQIGDLAETALKL